MDAARREAARTGYAWGVGALVDYRVGAGTFCCGSIAKRTRPYPGSICCKGIGEYCLLFSSSVSGSELRRVPHRGESRSRGARGRVTNNRLRFVRRFGQAEFVIGSRVLPRHNLLPNVESSETFERAVLELVVIRLFSAVNEGECLRRHPVGCQVRRWSKLAFQALPVRAFCRGPLPTRAPAAGSLLEARSTCRSSETFPAGHPPSAFSILFRWPQLVGV
jgi:hypothetical protein